MILNIKQTYNKIEQEIIDNEKDIFNLYNLYTRKFSKYSDRLNDCNVGLFLDDNLRPTVQIFLRNRTGYIRSHITFNKEGNKILDINQLNFKINE